MSTITKPQITRLAVLYGQYERHSLDASGSDRSARLVWASAETKRPIGSFKDLTIEEGKRLIDGLQLLLGTKVPSKTPLRYQSRKDGEKRGTEGRSDQLHAETTLVGPNEHRLLKRDLDRLGWNEARLQSFLASPRSPLKGSTIIRTLGDANKLHWALKRLKPAPESIAG